MPLGPKSTAGRGRQLREIAAAAVSAQWPIGGSQTLHQNKEGLLLVCCVLRSTR